jgi:GGDEF domain-containing protein
LCNIQGGLVFADRIRDALEDFTKRTGTTVSAGIASHRGEGDGTVAGMLESLRGALVAARSAGGDRVEISSEGWSV